MHRRSLLLFSCSLALGCPPVDAAAAESRLDFQRDVRPILSNHCLQCHGPDEEGRKGELRLDDPQSALNPAESGKSAIVPAKPDASELVARVFAHDSDELMPPPGAKKPLTDAQKDILRRWVTEGAPYSEHWSFIKPTRPEVPSILTAGSRVENAIDAFILAKLADQKLPQSPPADAHALARRVALDLTGLPPTPEELTAFVKDRSPRAYEAFVEGLLKSPHYGERWARRWLDLARYADTNGYEKDRERSIWPYRDWVIQALNADMPFNQFTIEQLAGDMLPNPTPQQLVATGFHRNTMLNEEGGIDPLEFRFHAMTDRVATTGTTWLGLTIGCAQCHTHKYDPITHTEYFGMMAFLNNSDEPDFDLPDPKLAAEQKQRLARADAILADLKEKHRESEAAAFAAWLTDQRQKTPAWQTLRPTSTESNLPVLTVQPDGSVLGSGDITKSDKYELSFDTSAPQPITALRLEALPHESLPAHGPGLCYYEGPKGDFFMGEFQVIADGQPVKIITATESYAKNNFGKNPATAAAAIDGDPQTGWSCAGRYGQRHEAVFVLEKPVAAKKLKVTMLFGRHYACPLGHFRISATTQSGTVMAQDLDETLAASLRRPDAALSAQERDALFGHYLLTAAKFAKPTAPIAKLREPIAGVTTLVMRERPAAHPRETRRHHRGEFTQPKEVVSALTPAVLHPLPADAPKNRLAFARWLMSPENPLTARVVVNRQWSIFFGRGLVETVDDFGLQGSIPSHPELLDWLATEFVRQDWSMKQLHKLIVMSAVYRQSAAVTPEAASRDPENVYLSHFPSVRLDGEIIRDSMLRASGLLQPRIGGPSVYPPQPDSVTEAAYGKFKWPSSTGADRYRRSLYTFSKRTAPFAMFTTFDGPTGEACLAKRESSNTPLQALTTMNDIGSVEAAQALGLLLAQQHEDDAETIQRLYLRILCRAPDAKEQKLMTAFIQTQRQRLQQGELKADLIAPHGDAKALEAAVWTVAARAVFNLDEFITKG